MTELSDALKKAPDLTTEHGRNEAVSKVKSAAEDAGDHTEDAAADVRRKVSDSAAAARDWAADQSDALRDTVQTKPFIAVGVSAASAFAIGLVLGVLLARD